MCSNIETSRHNSYICPHSFTPLRQRRKSRSDAVEVTLKKLPSFASIRLRGTVMAANRKTRQNNTVTPRQYVRRAVYVSGDVRFQDGDAFDLGKQGGGTFNFIFFYCYSMSARALPYFAITYTYRTTVVLWYNGFCDIRVLFVHDANQCAWRRL